MLKSITYRKSKPARAAALLMAAVIIAVSFLAPFTSIVNGDHFAVRFNVEDYDKSYSVSYGGQSYSIEVHIPGKMYYSYADEPRHRTNGSIDYASYVVIDEVVQGIADDLINIAKKIDGGSDYVLASLILDFVHQTDYKRDNNKDGIEIEYPKTPVETLVECGDCEDLAALFVSIALAAGLDAVLFMFPKSPGHMAAGVYIGDNSNPSNIQTYWTDSSSGKSYYYCEGVSKSSSVGDVSQSYVLRKSEMIPFTEFPNA